MQFKHKLIYFALGCAFVVIGQVLLSVVVPKVTAQGKKEKEEPAPKSKTFFQEWKESQKEIVEFDTVKVRSLQVVDDSGKVYAIFEKTKRNARVDDVIRVFDGDGVSVCRVGVTTSGGNVAVYDNKGEGRSAMGGENAGGSVWVFGNDGKTCALMGVNESGHGVVQTLDKDGAISGILGGISSSKSTSSSSTPQREKYEDVKLFPGKPFVEIGGRYAVRNIRFDKTTYQIITVVRVMGEVRIPTYVSTTQLTAQFTISLFDASGKYLGGKQFDVYGVVPKGGIYPFSVDVDVTSKDVGYCQIRTQGAWGPKQD